MRESTGYIDARVDARAQSFDRRARDAIDIQRYDSLRTTRRPAGRAYFCGQWNEHSRARAPEYGAAEYRNQ